MKRDPETNIYHVRATEPESHEQKAYECVGFAMAHAKAAELRMSGHTDVVMSLVSATEAPPT
ncbi:MAG: hypothetical protein ACOY4R_02815 [Pseudomonadota bacterium]